MLFITYNKLKKYLASIKKMKISDFCKMQDSSFFNNKIEYLNN